MNAAPVIQPVITPEAHKWLSGEWSAERYFAWARARAETEAQRFVAEKLRGARHGG